MMRIVGLGAVLLALVLGTPVPAQDRSLLEALLEIDVPAISDWAERADAAPSETALAAGVLAALRREDDAAAAQLLASTADETLSPDLRRAAWLTLFTLRLRQGRYDEAVAAMDAADALGAEPDPARAQSNAQARALAAALAEAPPMRASPLVRGELAIRRDLGGLLRAETRINDVVERGAVLDTGAGFSSITESRAERAGLRIIGKAPVSTASVATLAAGVAVADRLTLGDMELENVVFLVLPDDALSFAGGLYTIDAIIGLPVLIELGRLEIREDGRRSALVYGPSPHRRDEASNLFLNGLNPLVLAAAEGADGPLLMTLDSGARVTSLTPLAAEAYPGLFSAARTETGSVVGAGGSRSAEIQVIPALGLSIGGFDVALEDVGAGAFARDLRHGVIGQDVLRAGAGYVLDFQAMRLEILPPE